MNAPQRAAADLESAICAHLQTARVCAVAWEQVATASDLDAAQDEASSRAKQEIESGVVMWRAFADLVASTPVAPADSGPVEHAGAAAQAVRALAHAQGASGRVMDPAVLDDVVSELAALASRLPQVLRQCAVILDELVSSGRVEHDRGGDVVAVAADVRDVLGLAAIASQAVADGVDKARQQTASLYGVTL